MDVDVFLWGGTHKFEAYELEGKFFVNPGSATGAMNTGWGFEKEDPTPSFCLMDVSSESKGGEHHHHMSRDLSIEHNFLGGV